MLDLPGETGEQVTQALAAYLTLAGTAALNAAVDGYIGPTNRFGVLPQPGSAECR